MKYQHKLPQRSFGKKILFSVTRVYKHENKSVLGRTRTCKCAAYPWLSWSRKLSDFRENKIRLRPRLPDRYYAHRPLHDTNMQIFRRWSFETRSSKRNADTRVRQRVIGLPLPRKSQTNCDWPDWVRPRVRCFYNREKTSVLYAKSPERFLVRRNKNTSLLTSRDLIVSAIQTTAALVTFFRESK